MNKKNKPPLKDSPYFPKGKLEKAIKRTDLLYFYHLNDLKYYELTNEILVGRNVGVITIPSDNKLSGKHFIVSLETNDTETQVCLIDLGSKNKTVLNREEIPAHQKMPVTMNSLIEVGSQQFLLTDSNTVPLKQIEDIVSKWQKKSIIKAQPKVTEITQAPPLPHSPENISKKEALLNQLKMNLETIETKTNQDLRALEDSKLALIKMATEQIAQKTSQINELVLEIESLKIDAQKFREEIQQKKQKIINLKNLGSD